MNKGFIRGLGLGDLLPERLKDVLGRVPVAGDLLVRDPASPGGVRMDSTLYQQNPVGMSFLSPANGLLGSGPANTRRACQSLTASDGISGSTSFTDTNMRMAFQLPVTPTRFRLKFNNQSASFGGAPGAGTAGAVSITGMWIGKANIPANAPPSTWAGDFLSAPTLVAPAATVGSGGTEAIYVTPWFDNVHNQVITAHTLMAASVGWTLSGTSLGATSSQAYMAQGTNCSLAANAGGAAWNPAAGTVTYAAFGDLQIEFEYVGSNPIGLWLGDSIMGGFQGANPVNPQPVHGPIARYPERVGLRLGHIAMNGGALGKSLTGALSSSGVGSGVFTNDFYYGRFWFNNPTTLAQVPTIPDYAVIALGTNDLQRWDNTPTVKTQFTQMVQTLRQGLGIQRIFALTIPPYPNAGNGVDFWTRPMHGNTGAASTTTQFEQLNAFDSSVLMAPDNLSTTVNQVVTINSANFTGTQTLTLTSTATANGSGGYAQIGGTGGCIIRYTGVSGSNLQNVLFVKGTAVTTVAGTTAVVGVNWITLDTQGGTDNALFESCYLITVSTTSNVGTITFALTGANQQTAHAHSAPSLITSANESMRQILNAWLRQGPPGVDATIEIAMPLEWNYQLTNQTTNQQGSMSVTTMDAQHPYFFPWVTANAHPRSAAFHNFVAGLISPQLTGI